METSTTTEQTKLSRADMDRLAATHGCTINTQHKPRRNETYVFLRTEGTQIYLGYLSAIEVLSEEQLAAKIAAKLEE